MLNFGLSNNTLTKKGADLKSVPLNLSQFQVLCKPSLWCRIEIH